MLAPRPADVAGVWLTGSVVDTCQLCIRQVMGANQVVYLATTVLPDVSLMSSQDL